MIGSGPCAGATHFTVLLANYLAGVLRKKTAVLEWNGHGDLTEMEAFCMGRRSERKEYHVLDVLYVKNAGLEELVSCINRRYDRIIIDFGDSFSRNRTEFLRCDRRIVLLALSEWQMARCLEFTVLTAGERDKGWEYYTVFGSEETRLEIKRKLGLAVQRVPFSVDAFTVTREIMAFFKYFDDRQ